MLNRKLLRIESASVLSPVFGAVVIGWASFFIGAKNPSFSMVIPAMIVGMPLALVISILSSIVLRKKFVRNSAFSYLACAGWGGAMATVAAMIIVGPDPIGYALVAWGLVSGLMYRLIYSAPVT